MQHGAFSWLYASEGPPFHSQCLADFIAGGYFPSAAEVSTASTFVCLLRILCVAELQIVLLMGAECMPGERCKASSVHMLRQRCIFFFVD